MATQNDKVRILFVGNDITLGARVQETDCWQEGNSYLSRVTQGIVTKTQRTPEVQVLNLTGFEKSPFSYEMPKPPFEADYLIVALGEILAQDFTVPHGLPDAFVTLLNRFLTPRTKPTAAICGLFGQPGWLFNASMAHAASDLALTFVPMDCTEEGEIAERILEGLFPTKSGYDVWVDGVPVSVRPIRVSALPFNLPFAGYQRPVEQTEVAGMVKLQATGETRFRVRPERSFQKAVVRPLHAGVQPTVENGEVCFTLPKPGYYVLELDGYHCPLEIFVDEKRDFSKEREEANIVFGPGIHEPLEVKLKSHDRVYLDPDAVVMGSFRVDHAEDVKVSGYGIICGSRNRRSGALCFKKDMESPIRIEESKDVVIDGPVVLDSPIWCVTASNSRDIELAHLKITGAWQYNTDGIDICNSQHVRVHDCFVHVFDDVIVMKGNYLPAERKDPEEDIRVERCVCWCSWGRTLEIGYETWASAFRDILFEDCDLIHNVHAAMSVHLGGDALVQNITFRNIRIEYDASEMRPANQRNRDDKGTCPAPWSGYWLDIWNRKMFPTDTNPNSFRNLLTKKLGIDFSKEPQGTCENVTVEEIEIFVGEGAMPPPCNILPSTDSEFGTITISRIRVHS